MRAAERNAGLGEALSTAVARAYHKLLAAKDEWEVARLFAAPEFQKALAREFEGDYQAPFPYRRVAVRAPRPGKRAR